MQHILLIDDDHTLNKILSRFLEKNGYKVSTAMHAKTAWDRFIKESFDLVLTDYRLPDLDGIELMSKMKSRSPHIPVILITNYSDVRSAVKSMKLGAFDYISKPLNPDQLLIILNEAFKQSHSPEQIKNDNNQTNTHFVSGKSPEALKVYEHAKLVATTDMSVLILGESGTGKEHISRLIHRDSRRANNNFVAVDCGTLSKDLVSSELFGHVKGAFTGAIQDKTGLFEMAHTGTLFLDEIGNLPYDVQVQLLRAIEERRIRKVGSTVDIEVDVRIIAATNETLNGNNAQNKFRSDLYYRLNEFTINVPSLRHRAEDIPEFAQYFLSQACIQLKKENIDLSEEFLQGLMKYDWPGNLRELKNVMKRIALLATSTRLKIEDLPPEIKDSNDKNYLRNPSGSLDIKERNESNEKDMIIKALEQSKYNKSKAAELLNIGRKTLYNKLKKFGLE